VLLVGGALAYFAPRQPNVVETAPPVVMDQTPPVNNTVVVENNVPVPVPNSAPNTVVVQPPPVTSTTNSVTRIERDRERVVHPPANSSPARAPGKTGDTNVTINNAQRAPAPGNAAPAPAGTAAGNMTGNATPAAGGVTTGATPGY
jgi:hypothetical protein